MTLADPPTFDRASDVLETSDGKLYELIDGILVEKSKSFLSIRIATNIASRLDAFVGYGERGWVLSELTIDCFPWRERYMRRPDVCFFMKSRLPVAPTEGLVSLAPDLCVEVISPNDNAYEVDRKTEDYFRAGVALVIHVFPETRTIHVFRPDGSASVLRDGQTLTGGEVLPGFTVAVADVFPPRST